MKQSKHTVQNEAVIARVARTDATDFGAVGTTPLQGLSVFSIPGVESMPREEDFILLLPAEGTQVCAGVLSKSSTVKPGEIKITSSGGASIYLKNNGDVVINGTTIPKKK